MSTEIIYNRQFIKVDNHRVIPFLEMGSSNCYDANGGKRARDWANSYGFTNGHIIVSNDNLLKNIDNLELSEKERREDYAAENFGWHVGFSFYGKSTWKTTFSSFRAYYKNGIKQALTIEELLEHNIKIQLRVYRWADSDITDKGLEIKPNVTFESTEHMVNTIEEYENYYRSEVSLYLTTSDGYWIERMKKTKNKEKVSKRKEKKLVEVNEFFALVDHNGGYFVRNIKYGYKYSMFLIGRAKKFISQTEAEKFKSKMKNGELFSVKKVEGHCTFKI